MAWKAVQCFEQNYRSKLEQKIFDKEVGESLLYLVRYFRSRDERDKMIMYADRLSDFPGAEYT